LQHRGDHRSAGHPSAVDRLGVARVRAGGEPSRPQDARRAAVTSGAIDSAMIIRSWLAAILVIALSAAATAAQDTPRQQPPRGRLARGRAGWMLAEPARRGLDEQVSVAIVRSIGVTLQGRLNRPLLEMEWHTLGDIVTRFVADTLTAERTEELASQVYARH